MKIAPAALLQINPTPAARSAAMPGSPFEQLLDAANLPLEGRQRAFGFSELGVFGAASAIASAAALEMETPEVPLSQMAALSLAASRLQEAQLTPNARRGDVYVGGSRDKAPPAPRSRLVSPQHSSIGPLADAAPPTLRETQTDGEEISVGVRRSAARHLTQVQPKRLSLIVSEQNGAIQILAGSPELGPEARERLRKAAAELAAEFGVTLAQFTLNGSAVEPTFVSQTGAPHGDQRG